MKTPMILAALTLLAAPSVRAEEQPVPLKDAPGRQAVMTNCGSCHSLDYPRTNAPFLDRKGWEAEVAKMINAYGAPIKAQDAPIIVDYLAKNYGTGG